MTTYPFVLPAVLRPCLPPLSRDGRRYVDVRFRGKWDGVLVIDEAGLCVGVYVQRRIREVPLPFLSDEIESVRKACLHNRILAAFPFDLWGAALITILGLSPLVLALGFLLWQPLVLISVVGCAIAIHVMYLYGGFPLMRLPVALLGLGQILAAVFVLLHWFP